MSGSPCVLVFRVCRGKVTGVNLLNICSGPLMPISELVRSFGLLLELVHLKKVIFNLSHEK